MKSPQERYYSDPQFHALVDLMLHYVIEAQFTPTELREAAMLAAIRYSQMYPAPQRLIMAESEVEKWLIGKEAP